MGYDEIRAALGQGFSVDSLHEITRVGHALLDSEIPLQHPSAAYALAATAQKIAWYWDGQPVRDDTAAVIEAHIKPKMEAVLDSADGDADTLLRALDDLARAYADTAPFLKSIGT